jgi:hypothetical protein
MIQDAVIRNLEIIGEAARQPGRGGKADAASRSRDQREFSVGRDLPSVRPPRVAREDLLLENDPPEYFLARSFSSDYPSGKVAYHPVFSLCG